MLNMITGVAKSGKTRLIRAQVARSAAEGRHTLLIVPEQASFYNERALQTMREQDLHRAQVLSFSRFAELVLRQLGGRERQCATAAAQVFLMSVALDELSDVLNVYGRHYRSRGFIEQTLAIIEECKNAGVSPQTLSATALNMPEGSLKSKVYELSLIFDAFEAVLHRSYVSTHDLLAIAAEKLEDSALLKGAHIYVDDFGGFTAPELALMSVMLGRAERLTVALCCDGLHTRQPAFTLAADTIERLKRMAQSRGATVQEVALPEPQGGVPALCAMEYATRTETPPSAPGGAGVQGWLCANPADELESVAADIARLVNQEGYRYREFAVIARDMTRYASALPAVFARHGLPFFWDMRRDARSSALIQGVLAAVTLACGMREADWLAVARSPLAGLDAELVGELENYCFVWSVSSAMWEHAFVNNPDGLLENMSTKAAHRLSQLEAARQSLIAPVLALREAVKSGRGGEIARGLWQYLQDVDAAKHLTEFADGMAEADKAAFLEEQSLLWQQLMELISLFDAVSSEFAITAQRVAELVELACGGFEVATVPRTLDEVAVGTADRMRTENARVVYLLGAVEGEFPSSAMPGGLLSEPERRKLSQSGLTLLTEGDRSQATEKMFCYRAVTAPTERLVVCCPRTDASGAALLPSPIYMRAQALALAESPPAFGHIWTAAGLEKAIAEQSAAQAELEALVQLGLQTLGPRRVNRLLQAGNKRRHQITDDALAQDLFGQRLKLSPSRLEQYYKCPFTYFIQKGLGATVRQKAELSPLHAGTLIHRVLQVLLSRHGGKGLCQVPHAQLRQEIDDETAAYLTECVGALSAVPARMLRSFERVGGWLFEMVCHLAQELAQSMFEPVAFELEIGEGRAVAPLVLSTPSGTQVVVEGTVDRVDVATVDGKKYVRVLDYKSGDKRFLLEDVYYGLNLQMLVYLFTIQQNGSGALDNVMPAGALYVPAQGSYISGARDTNSYALEKLKHKQYKMNGLLLSDEAVLRAMEQDLGGVYIGYTEGKKTETLCSLTELGRLRRLVEDRITQMAQGLHSGEIAAEPSCRGDETPCGYCDYRFVCGFEQGDPTRALVKVDRDIIFDEGRGDDGE